MVDWCTAKLAEKHERRKLREERRKVKPQVNNKETVLGKRAHFGQTEAAEQGRRRHDQPEKTGTAQTSLRGQFGRKQGKRQMGAKRGRTRIFEEERLKGKEPLFGERPRTARKRGKGDKKSKSKKKAKKKKKHKKKSGSRKASRKTEDYSCSEGEVRPPRRRSRKERM